MKKTRCTDEQIAFASKQAETGTPVAEVTRRMAISEQNFYCWKKMYGGLGVGELRRVRQLEDENRKRKALLSLWKGGWSSTSASTSTSCKIFWQKSSDAWTMARDRRARSGVPRCQRAAQLPRVRHRPLVGELCAAQAGSDAAAAAHS